MASAEITSNLKLITSGTIPTTSNLANGELAFGLVGGVAKLYGNVNGTIMDFACGGGGGGEVWEEVTFTRDRQTDTETLTLFRKNGVFFALANKFLRFTMTVGGATNALKKVIYVKVAANYASPQTVYLAELDVLNFYPKHPQLEIQIDNSDTYQEIQINKGDALPKIEKIEVLV